jgi:hypothetical protein
MGTNTDHTTAANMGTATRGDTFKSDRQAIQKKGNKGTQGMRKGRMGIRELL